MIRKITYTSKVTLTLFFLISGLLIWHTLFANVNGAPSRRTNAPNESNCTSGCHTGTLITSGTKYNSIIFENNFTSGGYVPDSTYDFTIKYKASGTIKIGFQATALASSNNDAAGTFSNISGTRTATGTVSGKTRYYITHSSSSVNGTDSVAWTFNWKAPSTNVGKVKLYLTVNHTNRNSGTSGDDIIAKVFEFGSSTTLPQADAGPDTTICDGRTIDFKGSGTKKPTSYSWTFPGGTPSSSNSQNVSVKYNKSGIYYAILKVKNSTAQSDPDTAVITVKTAPIAQITVQGSKTICTGDSVFLEGYNDPGVTYLWSPTNETTRNIYAKTGGTYTLTTKNKYCESTSFPVTITENKRPIISLSSSVSKGDSICGDQSVTFTATAGESNYIFFSGSDTLQNSASNTYITSSLASDDTISVIANASNGCNSLPSNTIITRVIEKPDTVNIVCTSTTSSLKLSWTPAVGSLGYEVSLDSGSNWINSNDGDSGHLISSLSPNQRVRVQVRPKASAPCNYGDVQDRVCFANPCKDLSFTLTHDTIVCKGKTTLIAVSNISVANYGINFDGAGYSNKDSFLVNPLQDTSLTLEVIDSNNLGCPTVKRNIVIKVYPDEPITLSRSSSKAVLCQYDADTLTITPAGMVKYQFWVGKVLLQNSSDNVYIYKDRPAGDQFVTVQATTKNGCREFSGGLELKVAESPDGTFSYDSAGSKYTFTSAISGKDFTHFWDIEGHENDTGSEIEVDFILGGKPNTVCHRIVDTRTGCESTHCDTLNLPVFTSIGDLEGIESISVFPNPVKDGKVGVRINSNVAGEYWIEVLDLQGRTAIQRLSVDINSGINEIDLAIDQLGSGNYFIKVGNTSGSATYKLLKL
jgi:hypothetical protein